MGNFPFRHRTIHPVMQDEAQECGLACLAMIATYLDHPVSLADLRRSYPVSRAGMSFRAVIKVAEAIGLRATYKPVAHAADLGKMRMPLFLHWDARHFVVLEKVRWGRYVIHDPAVGERHFSPEELTRHLSGPVLEFEPIFDFAAQPGNKREGFRRILAACKGLGRAIAFVVMVSLTISLLSLGGPILLQVALDTVLPREDSDLLLLLTIGYLGLMALEAIARWLRDIIVLRTAAVLQLYVTRNLIGHAFQLPLVYFEARHPGDFITRLDSIDQIKSFITRGLATAIADAIMSILTIVMMFIYSASLAAIVAVTYALLVIFRLAFFPALKRNAAETLAAQSQERSAMLDGLRNVPTLKIHRATEMYILRWFGLFQRFVRADFRMAQTEVTVGVILRIFIAISTAATVYLGVKMVIAHALTIGMLYAFFAFRSSFFERIEALIANITHMSTINVHLGRIADIAETKPETGTHSPFGERAIRQLIEVKNITIRFGFADTPLLEDVSLSLDVASGESIAICGPSGAGKSTLLRIIAGLVEPTKGHLLVDKEPITRFGRQAYRSNLGAVFADDGVFEASVRDNITLFDPAVSEGDIEQALDKVGLLNEVKALPQGVATRISDENSILSSGQRRRLLIARAISRHPAVLLLDEPTANLDSASEAALLERLATVPCAKVWVTHSQTVMKAVDRVYVIEGRRVRQRSERTSASAIQER